MIIAVPKEIKNNEFRVSLVPSGVEQLCRSGHKVLVETLAGKGSGIKDEEFQSAGAEIVASHEEVFRRGELIVKVKELLSEEYDLVREGQVVFTYFHFAANEQLTNSVINSKIVAIAYETIMTDCGRLPLLEPMSEIAGRMAVQEGAKYLEKSYGGKGKLLGGVPGVAPSRVLIMGGGTVGTNSAKMAAGLKADVVIMDTNLNRLRYLDDIMPPNVHTLYSNHYNIKEQIKQCDLIISAVLLPGKRAPKLITREMLKTMSPGTVIVDVAVDQGGSIETCLPTTHSDPIFIVNDIVHYCVANMPGAVAHTSTFALTNATMPYVLEIANNGFCKAALQNKVIASGLNIVKGQVTNRAVADSFDLLHTQYEVVLDTL